MRHTQIFIFALLTMINPLAFGGERSAASPQITNEDLRCVIDEMERIEKNKEQFSKLFNNAMENYAGKLPCIGAWADNRYGLLKPACGNPSPHYILGEIQSESSAALAGLRKGDYVISVNDKPIKYHLDFEVAVIASKPNENLGAPPFPWTPTQATFVIASNSAGER